MGLDMLSMMCPETSRSRDQEVVGCDCGSQERSTLEAGIGELSLYSLFTSFSIFLNIYPAHLPKLAALPPTPLHRHSNNFSHLSFFYAAFITH